MRLPNDRRNVLLLVGGIFWCYSYATVLLGQCFQLCSRDFVEAPLQIAWVLQSHCTTMWKAVMDIQRARA